MDPRPRCGAHKRRSSKADRQGGGENMASGGARKSKQASLRTAAEGQMGLVPAAHKKPTEGTTGAGDSGAGHRRVRVGTTPGNPSAASRFPPP